MSVVRRMIYLGYYTRHMQWDTLRRFMRHTRFEQGIGRPRQIAAFLADSLRYNIAPLEWYQFGFAGLTAEAKRTWAGTGTMYEFQRRANPPGAREILDDKRLFHEAYRRFFRHEVHTREALAADRKLTERLLFENDRLVLKAADGKCGASVAFINTAEHDPDSLISSMQQAGQDLAETPIVQHVDLDRLSQSGVNTVRIITALDANDQVALLGCRLRISVNSPVDNLAAGNLAAPVDEATGYVNGPGVYSDIIKPSVSRHPVTGEAIEGFRIPFWDECLQLARDSATLHSQNRSIGWDIAVTPEGPGLIEGNHDWCKLVWQLPVHHGLKAFLVDC